MNKKIIFLLILLVMPLKFTNAYYFHNDVNEIKLSIPYVTFSINIDGIVQEKSQISNSIITFPMLEKEDNTFLGYMVNDNIHKNYNVFKLNNLVISPLFEKKLYESGFYFNDKKILSTYNEYGSVVSMPIIKASDVGYDNNFYYLTFNSDDSLYQTREGNNFQIILNEYNCKATFGSSGSSNANYQLNYLKSAGYDICYVDGRTVACYGKSSNVVNIYNNAWNILPKSGNGYSKYKDIWCESNYTNTSKR